MESCSEGQIPSDRAETVIQNINQAKQGTNQLKDLLKDVIKSNPTVKKIMDAINENLSSSLSELDCCKTASDPGPTARGGSVCSDDRKSEISSGKRKAVPIPISDGRGASRRRSQASPGKTTISSTLEDGHTWRKYGQKIIQGSSHYRSYYRCTHKHDQGCQATRQTQRSEDNPSKYNITYIGVHTCQDPSTLHQIIDMPDSKEIGNSFLIKFGSNNYNRPTKIIGQEQQRPMPSPLQSPGTQGCSEEVVSSLTPGSSPADCFMLGDELAALVGSTWHTLNVSSIHDQADMLSSLHSSPRSLEMGFMPNSFALQLDQDCMLFGFDNEDDDFPSS
ncbi:putative WRKY transcription factor 70 [Carex littledalei]|uniref:Putative WRKY transcription factor 70 n=1 Tax=Carex littledalei TaxID=544730 RepID=A0A833R2N9_9POAL|nr:putative WRKY transcription factor 70 [Carex littledalei]